LGILACAAVTTLSSNFLWGVPHKNSGFSPSKILPAFGYVAWLLYQIVLANVNVLMLSFTRRVDRVLEPELVHFKTALKSDFAKFVFGNSITLTPGTVTLSIKGDHFTVHTLMPAFAAGLPGEMERRIATVFDE